jgi:carboxymethylenebutenolidase
MSGYAKFGAVDVPGQHGAALTVAPETGSPKRVIVLPGIHGRTPHILQVGQRLAGQGLEAVIADFYCTAAQRGELRTPADLGAATQALDHDAIATSTLELIESLPPARSTAILGYCVGGAIALEAGARSAAITAIVAYYAVLRPDSLADKSPDPLAAAERVSCPVLAHYGTTDMWCPPADIDELEARLATSGSQYQVYRYPGAGHAFEESGRPGYRPVAAADASRRTATFLDHYLAQVRI